MNNKYYEQQYQKAMNIVNGIKKAIAAGENVPAAELEYWESMARFWGERVK